MLPSERRRRLAAGPAAAKAAIPAKVANAVIPATEADGGGASATWSASAMSSACACNLSGPLIATCDRLPAQLVSGDEPDSPPNFLLLHQPGATTGKWTTGGCHQRLAPNCAVNVFQGRSELQCLHDELGAPNCVVNRGWRRQPRDNLAENNREY